MKKENKFIIAIILIAIITLSGVIFFALKYPYIKANKDADNIQVGDNTDLEDTPLEDIEQDIIHYDDEIGTLTIPDILLDNAPIRESVELTTLKETIGHFPSTSIYEGNVGLASHNSGEQGDFFKNLKKIKIGSEIFYQTNYGTKRYVVTVKEIIDEENWSYLQPTEDNRITLITCVAGQREKRLCVQAVESSEGMDYGILSGTMTYNKTNKKNDISIPQNIVENVDNTSQIETSNEEILSEEKIDESISSQEEVEQTPVVENTPEVKQKKPSTPSITAIQEQPIVEVKQESTEIKENNNNNTPQTKEESIQTVPETPKQEVIEEQPVIIGEEYKTNDAMINTIKNVINSNQSEDMKLYGYNVVVDSSIIDITSQFTYTEQRVIDKIKYKFGTIRIYARDYYNNGEYICTQCYII